MKIIGLCYKKGVGKNTFARFLSTHINATYPKLKVQEISFASKLKDVAYQLWGWAGLKRSIYYESHYEEKEIVLPKLSKSPRQLWIELGNKCREIYQDTWIDYTLNNIKADVIIVTDVGFLNEAKAIKKKSGKLIKIVRDDLPQGTDPREVELNSWSDWTIIDNNGSLDDLYKKAVDFYES